MNLTLSIDRIVVNATHAALTRPEIEAQLAAILSRHLPADLADAAATARRIAQEIAVAIQPEIPR